jgi:nucleoside-diphosphate-sugar epimerase
MRVLVAGGSGVIGRQLVPLLVRLGHDVTAIAHSARGAALLTEDGARAVEADLLDRPAVSTVVRQAAPDAVVHLATAIPGRIDPRRLARDFAMTNRLRTEGTRNLVDAATDIGVSRLLSQGLAYAYDPGPESPATEDEPLWREPPRQFEPVLAALVELERLTTQAGGLVLRLGHLYGPGSSYAEDGSFTAQLRAVKVPVVGGGTAVFSFTHAHDAATAAVAALDKDAAGILNIVDDHPVRAAEWIPGLAQMLHARRPGKAPAALARLVVGGWGVAFMTALRGADNTRAKLALDWKPRYADWRDGFSQELGRVTRHEASER